MEPNRRVDQPGPTLEPRVLAVACDAREAAFALRPGLSLLDAINTQLDGQDAVLHLHGGGLQLAYVIPALSGTPEHAAFYSDILRPAGETIVEAARVTFGRRAGAPWLHGHGFWRLSDGTRHGGHVIPDETIVTRPVQVQAWILDGAGFEAEPDPETGFTLFGPVARGSGPGKGRCLAVRLRPNQDICEVLEQLCGGRPATVRGGVASIIGVVFDGGSGTDNFATEMFIRHGRIGQAGCSLDVALVDYTGALWEGTLTRGANPVLMTAELLLELDARA